MGMHVWSKKLWTWASVGLAAGSLCLIETTNLSAQRSKQNPNSQRCLLEPGPRQTIVSIEDSETLRLADGRKIRLLGTLGPRAPLSAQQGTRPNATVWQPEQNAQEALRKLVEGRDVALAFDHRRQDRYGRWLAHVFVWHNGHRFWVQGELLAHGHARAYVLPGNTACVTELIAHEQQARVRARGLWRHRHYRILKPEPAGWLVGKRRHHFEIISGTVADIAIVKSNIYLNFGDNWRTDFTAALSKRALLGTRFSLADIIALKGQRVRVRGWIERKNGPYIKLAHPELIEHLDVLKPDLENRLQDPPALADARPDDPVFQPILPRLTVPRIKQGTKKRPTQTVPGALKL